MIPWENTIDIAWILFAYENKYSKFSNLNFELCDRIVIIYFQTLKGKMLQANQPKTNRMV